MIRSILWDLDIPQEAATINCCIQKIMTDVPQWEMLKILPIAQDIDIKYFALCEWIERDYIRLESIYTSIKMADHLSKPLTLTLSSTHRLSLRTFTAAIFTST